MKNLVLLCLGLTLVLISFSSVSAWQKTYDPTTDSILIESDLGVDLVRITLEYNTYFCVTDCEARLKIEVLKDGLSSPFSSFKIKKWVNNQWQEGSLESLTFQHNTSGEWQKLTFNQFNIGLSNKGTYWVRLLGTKKATETVDWIPSMFSGTLDLDEWALWDSGEIVHYYKFDEAASAAGTIFDELATVNLTNAGATNTTGIIGSGYNFDGADGMDCGIDSYVDLTSGGDGLSLNFWVKPTAFGGSTNYDFIFDAGSSPRTSLAVSGNDAGSSLSYTAGGSTINAPYTLSTGTWQMITYVADGTTTYLYVDGSLVYTNTTSSNWNLSGPDGCYFGTRFSGTNALHGYNGVMDEVGIWNIALTSNQINFLYNDGDANPYGESTISSTALSPSNNTYVLSDQEISFSSYAVSDTNLVNASLYINDTINETITISGITNTTEFNKTLGEGFYSWRIEVCDDSSNCDNSSLRFLTVTNFFFEDFDFDAFVFDTDYLAFNTSIIYNNNIYTSISAKLEYDGTNYTATQYGSGSTINFSKSLDIPVVSTSTNKNFYWYITLNGTSTEKSSQKTQNINSSTFSYCNDTYPTQFINISFKDEGNNSFISGKIDYSTFSYSLGGNIFKNYTYTNTTHSSNFSFCFEPAYETIYVNPTVRYSATGYPQRTWQTTGNTYTNTSTEQSLFLLSSADGIYSSIQVADATGSPLSGASVTVEASILGVWYTIGQASTGSDGIATFWVNPNYVHRITVVKSGYVTSQVSITPSQTLYTMTLTKTGGDVSYTSQIDGVRFYILPRIGPIGLGVKNFNVTITASNSDLENCKFELINATDLSDLLNSTTGLTNSSYCQLVLTYNVTAETNIFGRISVDTTETDGFVIINADPKWSPFAEDIKNWRKITSLFSDFNDLGEFGEDNEGSFSRIMFFFIVMTILLGVFHYFTGVDIANPGVSILLILGLATLATFGGFLTVELGSSTNDVQPFFEKFSILGILLLYSINYWIAQRRKA